MRTGLGWLRIGTGGEHLWVRWGTFGFHKTRGGDATNKTKRDLLHLPVTHVPGSPEIETCYLSSCRTGLSASVNTHPSREVSVLVQKPKRLPNILSKHLLLLMWVQLFLCLLPIQWGSSHFIQLDKRCKQNAGLQNKIHTKKYLNGISLTDFLKSLFIPMRYKTNTAFFSIWISLKITQSKSVF